MALIPLCGLAACAPAAEGAAVACGPAGGPLDRSCGLERVGDLLTLRQPNGGFRRLAIVADGQGFASADGAEEVVLTDGGAGIVEATVGGWTYRLPVTAGAR